MDSCKIVETLVVQEVGERRRRRKHKGKRASKRAVVTSEENTAPPKDLPTPMKPFKALQPALREQDPRYVSNFVSPVLT